MDYMPLVSAKLGAVARPGQLRDRDEGPLHSSQLEPQRPVEALGGPERGDLLAQVGQPRAVGRTITASSSLHGRFLNLAWEEAGRRDRLLGAAIDNRSDRPPPSRGLVKAAESRRRGLAFHGQRA